MAPKAAKEAGYRLLTYADVKAAFDALTADYIKATGIGPIRLLRETSATLRIRVVTRCREVQ